MPLLLSRPSIPTHTLCFVPGGLLAPNLIFTFFLSLMPRNFCHCRECIQIEGQPVPLISGRRVYPATKSINPGRAGVFLFNFYSPLIFSSRSAC